MMTANRLLQHNAAVSDVGLVRVRLGQSPAVVDAEHRLGTNDGIPRKAVRQSQCISLAMEGLRWPNEVGRLVSQRHHDA